MPAVTVRRRSSMLPLVLAVLFVGMVVIVAGFLLYLAAGGTITVPLTDPPTVLSFQKQEKEEKWTPPEGQTAIPCLGRSVDAFSKITIDDLIDPKTQRFAAIYREPDQIREGVIIDAKQIVGRVLKHDKAKGYFFTEADFYPEGTRPGLVAGVPSGMRGMWIDVKQVAGFVDLNPGDRFDLLLTVPLDGDAGDALKKLGGVHASKLALEAELTNISKQARVDVIVQNGVVVQPVRMRQVPIAAGSLNDPHGIKTKPVQEVYIAVEAAAAAKVLEALSISGAKVEVIARSGDPTEDAGVTPSSIPRSPFSGDGPESDTSGGSMHFVEQIGGKNREIVPVPTEKDK